MCRLSGVWVLVGVRAGLSLGSGRFGVAGGEADGPGVGLSWMVIGRDPGMGRG